MHGPICLTTSLSDLGGFLNFGVGWQGMLVISCCITVSRIVEGFDLTDLNYDLVKRITLQWTDLRSGSLGRKDAISITKPGPKRSFPLQGQSRCCPLFFLKKKKKHSSSSKCSELWAVVSSNTLTGPVLTVTLFFLSSPLFSNGKANKYSSLLKVLNVVFVALAKNCWDYFISKMY